MDVKSDSGLECDSISAARRLPSRSSSRASLIDLPDEVLLLLAGASDVPTIIRLRQVSDHHRHVLHHH